jgi:hypothetical protein
MPWKAIACSAKGTSHERTGKPCQDYASFIKVNNSGDADKNGDILIGAVCDGAGSCKHSDIGSELAVETSLKYLQSWLKWLKHEKKDLSQPIPSEYAHQVFGQNLTEVQKSFKDLSRPISSEYAHQVFGQNLTEVQKSFEVKAQELACSRKDFSCTLLVVIATPQWLAAMQIGDGFIVIRQPDSEYELLFQPIKGEYANQTTFITASNALQVMQVKVLPRPQQFIFASTDGLERLALDDIAKEAKPHPPFFDDFRDAIKTRSEAEEKSSTEEWLQSEKVNKRTDDDKTILLCWYKAADELKQSTQTSQSSARSPSESQPIPTFKPSGGYPPNPPHQLQHLNHQ